MTHLVRTVKDRTGALDYFGIAGLEARRGHASRIGRLGATGLAESIGGDAVEAEGGEHVGSGNQGPLVYRFANRGRVHRRAETAVRTAFGDRVFVHRMVEDAVYIYEVHSVGNIEAIAVRVESVRRQGAG